MALTAAKNVESSEFPFSPNNAVGDAGRRLQSFQAFLKDSIFWELVVFRGRARSRLADLGHLQNNWDSYGAPRPNAVALGAADRILKLMRPSDLLVAKIVPSAEGGVGFCFSAEDRYADIECSNSGDFLSVRYVGKATPTLIEIDGTDRSLERALDEIRKHICE